MKKMIGLALWLVAFLVPFRYSILDTHELIENDGTTDNVTGLLSFVAMITLLFIGYWLVDSSSTKGTEDAHSH